MGDHFRRRSNRNESGHANVSTRHRRSNRSRKRRRDDGDASSSDDGRDNDDPPLFFLNQDYEDEDQWREQYEYDRQRRRRQQRQQSQRKNNNNQPLDSFRRWAVDKTGVHIPRVNLHFDPITIVKIRKSWYDMVPGAIIRVGADFETHRRLGKGLWRLRGCVEDKLIGGRFTIKERKNGDDDRAVLMEYSKSWLFAGTGSFGTRFNLCAAYDLKTQRGSARFGFKAENSDAVVGSYQFMPGRKRFSIVPIIPIDSDKRLLLEARTNIDLPEPEFVIGTDFDGASSNGGAFDMGIGGDIDVEVEEVNLIFTF